MKVNKIGVFLVLDVIMQALPIAATVLFPPIFLCIILGGAWQLYSYYTLNAWGIQSKYRNGYINMVLFTLGALAVGALFVGIAFVIASSSLYIIGMALIGFSALFGAILYIIYSIVTLDSLVIEIEKCIKHRKEKRAYKNNLDDWWV